MKVIKVLLADDHPALRAGIKGMLEKADGSTELAEVIEVVGEAADGDEALRLAERLGPDVLVLDAVMPGLRAPQVIHRLRETRPDLRVLVLTAYDDNELVFGLLEAGAVGYVLKEEALETIEAAVRAVARGESWLSQKVAAKVMKKALGQEEAEEEAIPLSERELEVLRLVAKGRTDRQIGQILCISTTTVRSHVQSILEKLECANRTEVAVRAVTEGILPAEVDK
ncbi:MAG: response regulator transcription factor [Anaerolineales bacterium]|nr:MAG: response regulator transcription factor [Anaerolineales bacterium]